MILIVFMRKKWSNLEEFKHDFEHYCKEIHQVFATLDSRTAEMQNTNLSADTVK